MRRHVLFFVTLITVTLIPMFITSCGGDSDSNSNVSPPSDTPPAEPPALALVSFVSGLASPLDLQAPSDSTGRLFVVEQEGRVKIIRDDRVVSSPFLDLTSKVSSGGETGLLGLAFHPDYAQNGKFYLNYTRDSGHLQTVIAEYRVSAYNPDQADPASERILLTIDQPFTNHKGGQLAFGTDGFLYIALGDGGGTGDPHNNGQSLQTLLGKILRIDVNTASGQKQYGIPRDNPFVAGGGLPEIYAYGFRNPWRFSVDARTGRIFVADVGQSSREEIDLLEKGANFGWNVMEGSQCFEPSTGCDKGGLVLPITDYGRDEGKTVIGGYVYHGSTIPALQTIYVFGDFISGNMWGLQRQTDGTWKRIQLASTDKSISSLGQDQSGELYVVDYSGSVWKVAAQ
jgi:glucose/arabinose dehydrogenase